MDTPNTLVGSIELSALPAQNRSCWRVLPFIAGICVFSLLVLLSDPQEIARVLHPDKTMLCLSLITSAIMYWVLALRWHLLASSIVGRDIGTPLDFYLYFLTASSVGFVLPQSVSILTIGTTALNRLHDVPLHKSAVASITENMLGSIPISIFILPALGIFLNLISLPQALLLILLMWLLITLLIASYPYWLSPVLSHVVHYVPIVKTIPPIPKQIVWEIYHYTLMSQCLLIFNSWLIARALGMQISPLIILLGTALNHATMLISITPGGLGIREGAWYVILSNTIPAAQISPFLLGHRVFNWLAVGLLWSLAYVAVLIRRNRVPPAP